MQQYETLEAFSEYADLLEGHSAVLDMLARLYYAPLSQEDLLAIDVASLDALRFGNDDIDQGLAEMASCLKTGGTTLRQDMNADYTAAFYGIVPYEGRVANPCESVFRSETGLLFQQACQKVYRVYKKEGVKKDESVGVPDDHLSFELQFLSIMCKRAADAVRRGDFDEAVRNLDVQRLFLSDHVLAWFDDLASLALHILETPFYRGVVKATGGFFEVMEADLRDVKRGIVQAKECVGDAVGDGVRSRAAVPVSAMAEEFQ